MRYISLSYFIHFTYIIYTGNLKQQNNRQNYNQRIKRR